MSLGRAGKDARLLWDEAGVMCAASNVEERAGVVEAWTLRDLGFLTGIDGAAALRKACAALVEVGLWHDFDSISRCPHECADLAELQPGDFYFHDWEDWQIPPGKQSRQRMAWRRNKALRSSACVALRDEIQRRDRDRCRYCAVLVSWTDRRSSTGATYDHVDPWGDNSPANVVTACRGCNGIKKDRTPTDAADDLAAWWEGDPDAIGGGHGRGHHPDSVAYRIESGALLLPAGTGLYPDGTGPQVRGNPGKVSSPISSPKGQVSSPTGQKTWPKGQKTQPKTGPHARGGNGPGSGQVPGPGREGPGTGTGGGGKGRAGPGAGRAGTGREAPL